MQDVQLEVFIKGFYGVTLAQGRRIVGTLIIIIFVQTVTNQTYRKSGYEATFKLYVYPRVKEIDGHLWEYVEIEL